MATRNMVAKIAGILTLACIFCASSVQAANLVCAKGSGELIRMMLERTSEVPDNNYAEMVKKIDEMFQDPATLALMEKNYTVNNDNSGAYFIARVRTALLFRAISEIVDRENVAKTDLRYRVTKCLNVAKSKFKLGDFELALGLLDFACLNLALSSDTDSDVQEVLRDIARFWLKAKLAQSKKLLQSRQETQQAQNGEDTSEQRRIMQEAQEEYDREMRRWQQEMRMDKLRLKQYEVEAKRREDAIRREQHRINMDRVRRTAESFQGMFGD